MLATVLHGGVMASKRMLQSALFDNDFFGSLDFFERLLWIGLFGVVADDQGRFWKNPVKIRSAIFPYDEIKDTDIGIAIGRLIQAGKVSQYKVGNKAICQLIGWWKHQKPSWASPSKYAPPDGWVDRLKYHQGSTVVMENWKEDGGYTIPIDIPIDIPIETVVSSKIKEVSSKDKKQEQPQEGVAVDKPNIFFIYEKAVGPIPLSEKIINELKNADDKFAPEWIQDAFDIAVENNARNWAYVRAILERWESSGRDTKKSKNQSTQEMLALWEAEEE